MGRPVPWWGSRGAALLLRSAAFGPIEAVRSSRWQCQYHCLGCNPTPCRSTVQRFDQGCFVWRRASDPKLDRLGFGVEQYRRRETRTCRHVVSQTAGEAPLLTHELSDELISIVSPTGNHCAVTGISVICVVAGNPAPLTSKVAAVTMRMDSDDPYSASSSSKRRQRRKLELVDGLAFLD